MKFKVSKTVCQKIIDEYCKPAGASPNTATILKNQRGEIGGYQINFAFAGDAPANFLDCDGNWLATFHIFGNPQKKEKESGVLELLTNQFPLKEPLDCAKLVK